MKVVFRTNVDHYKTNCWPTNIEMPPRKGEYVMVTDAFIEYYNRKKLPVEMEVTNVTWTDKGVLCELWFKDIDIEAAKLAELNLFN